MYYCHNTVTPPHVHFENARWNRQKLKGANYRPSCDQTTPIFTSITATTLKAFLRQHMMM